MMLRRLRITFTAADLPTLVAGLLRTALPSRPPDGLEVDYADADPDTWASVASTAEEVALWHWEGLDDSADLAYVTGRHVSVELAMPRTVEAVVDLLAGLPFDVATLPSYGPQWQAEHDYRPPGFDGGHPPHGWACAFRGFRGHDRLVSRRWLDHGPWALHRRDGDVSVAVFHQPDMDPEAALQQARAGHDRMGISETGGYLQDLIRYAEDDFPAWDSDGVLRVVVNGRSVSQGEMLSACQLRRQRRHEQPTADIAYVFLDEGAGARSLPELWLRELQCWQISSGQQLRLDDPKNPP
jgi:hypothetical protein